MADFESAARRLAADQSKLRSKARANRNGGGALSAKAKREAERRRKREEERRKERERTKKRAERVGRYMAGCDRELGVVRSLSGAPTAEGGIGGGAAGGEGRAGGDDDDEVKVVKVVPPKPPPPASTVGLFGGSGAASAVAAAVAAWPGASSTGLMLATSSVHGDGDKIALPPSVLAVLAERGMMEGAGGGRQPLTFRIGVLRDGYAFPSSKEMIAMMESDGGEDGNDMDEDENDDMDVDGSNHDDGGGDGGTSYEPTRTGPYLSELSRRYVSYTHGTVVEFTQEEGHVGLPAGIASALLDPQRRRRGRGDGEGDGGEQMESDSGEEGNDMDEDENDDDMDVDESNHDDGDGDGGTSYEPTRTGPYLSELSRRYVSYTHGTVVEFTQEEGHVGLPAGIASALLDPQRRRGGRGDEEGDGREQREEVEVPRTRTVDPAAAAASASEPTAMDDGEEGEESAAPAPAPASADGDAGSDERTPGHPAYGLFDVPACRVEVTLLRLPRGKRAKLIPTPESIKHGFYNLKDVKLVLEQSLIRTRATLSVGDVVHAWHRGTRFDLRVGGVQPAEWGAVSCIDTDIEVDIAAPEEEEEEGKGAAATGAPGEGGVAAPPAKKGKGLEGSAEGSAFAPGQGRRLTDDDDAAAAPSSPSAPSAPPASSSSSRPLPPEPPADLREGVVTVQVRGDGVAGRRRFLCSSATMGDVFAFAASLFGESPPASFRLVTRFPRRAFERAECSSQTMEEAGIQAGQEMFMVERTG
eukprot:CAMPEP_0197465792 /NCGR_PEP_ID=MMETSP1175-20131217/64721_1 /TAXON_ID=1003142 /ORGANISM="Triceratium dubium, Strain CCMP147" /LENGTH=755 /DNA_ID=CAMNT_0043001815 /DNA_START=162 /DNA_END=2429 /DNA_ORIENTATION=-